MKMDYLFLFCACVFPIFVKSEINGNRQNPQSRTTSGDRGRRQNGFCPSNTYCVPLESCPLLNNIMNHDCVLSSRLGALGCGYQGSGLVCCPQLTASNTVNAYRQVDGHKCGGQAVQGQGDYAGLGAYPWIARVGFKSTQNGDIKYPCEGSVLNERVILTAAHCALAKADHYKLFSVRVGEWLTDSDIDCGDEFCALPAQDVAISHVIVHPNYEKQTYRNNVALLVLSRKLNYTVTAQPICLPEPWSVTNYDGLLVGWGKLAGQRDAPPYQQHIRVPIVNLQQCVNIYGRTLPISDDNLCAGGERGVDACTGFGGGPLLVRHGDTYYQVGILSYGSDQCGAAGVPSVYTDIKKYVAWIRDNLPVIYDN